MLHGCIPVIVMDNVEEAFEGVLDHKEYSIRISESDIERTPEILRSISDAQLLQMQRSLAKVWNRFAWARSSLHRTVMPAIYSDNRKSRKAMEETGPVPSGSKAPILSTNALQPDHPFLPKERFPVREDAFSTLMMWLHGRAKAGYNIEQ